MDARTHLAFDSFPAGAAALPALRAESARPAGAERRQVLLRHVALLCAALMLAVVSLSAFLRLSKVELACAQWPQCHGQSLREARTGPLAAQGEGPAVTLARLAHRVVASTALLLVLAMAALCLAARPRLWPEGRVALTLLALALGLSVLGIWSSDPRIPAVAMGNLLGGFAMLALCWRLAGRGLVDVPPWLRAWAWVGVLLIAWQGALGAMVSAPHAASICKDLADCVRASLDAPGGAPWSALNPWHEPTLDAAPKGAGALAQVAHRLSAMAALLVLLPLGLAAMRHGRALTGALLLALLAAALEMGLLMAGNGASLGLTLAHNLVSALLLATVFELTRGPDARRAA